MLTASVLVFLGVLCRIVPHPPNAVAIGAVALYAGARLPRRWAWIVPVAAMALADVVLDWGTGRSWLGGGRWVGYATYAVIALAGILARNSSNPARLAALSVGGSVLFFITSNLAVWAFGDGVTYPHTYEGLVACFTAAIPFLGTGGYGFFMNDVVANLTGVGVLFGFDHVAGRLTGRRRAAATADAPTVSA